MDSLRAFIMLTLTAFNIQGEILSTYKHNGVHCKKCPQGTRVSQHCQVNFANSTCQQCPTGTYQPNRTRFKNCLQCDVGCYHDARMTVVSPCTRTQNLQCRCPTGMFLKELGLDVWDCTKYKTCPVGQIEIEAGTPLSDRACRPCDVNMFLNTSSQQCQTCSSCPEYNQTVVVPCGPTSDAVCKEQEGTTEEPSSPSSTTTTKPEHLKPTRNIWAIVLLSVVVLISVGIIITLIILCVRNRGNTSQESDAEETHL